MIAVGAFDDRSLFVEGGFGGDNPADRGAARVAVVEGQALPITGALSRLAAISTQVSRADDIGYRTPVRSFPTLCRQPPKLLVPQLEPLSSRLFGLIRLGARCLKSESYATLENFAVGRKHFPIPAIAAVLQQTGTNVGHHGTPLFLAGAQWLHVIRQKSIGAW
jgi:hypothetical protein